MVAEHIAWVEENFWGLKNKLKESPHSMVYGTMFTYTTYHLEYIPKYLWRYCDACPSLSLPSLERDLALECRHCYRRIQRIMPLSITMPCTCYVHKQTTSQQSTANTALQFCGVRYYFYLHHIYLWVRGLRRWDILYGEGRKGNTFNSHVVMWCVAMWFTTGSGCWWNKKRRDDTDTYIHRWKKNVRATLTSTFCIFPTTFWSTVSYCNTYSPCNKKWIVHFIIYKCIDLYTLHSQDTK